MDLRSTVMGLLLAGWLWMSAAHAAPPTGAQVEISFLLGYIEGSGCEFYRNGTWNNSRAAQAHLRDKYRYLAEKNQIETAEQFIDKAATESSLSGQAYMVRCNGGAALTSRQWLRDELARLRTF
jgi:Family of unknown function (DUF5329)